MNSFALGDNVIYLEGGRLHLGEITNLGNKKTRILSKNKIKRKIDNNKIITKVEKHLIDTVINKSLALAKEINMENVWELANGQAISIENIIKALNLNQDNAIILAALNLNQVRNGGYFSINQNMWHPVSKEKFAKIKTAMVHRKKRIELEKQYKLELEAGKLPDEVKTMIANYLNNNIDPNNHIYRFLLRYCKNQNINLAQLAYEFNLISDLASFHARECTLNLPVALEENDEYQINLANEQPKITNAIAIDACGTIEVDDAFALAKANDNEYVLNISVASPGLGLSEIALKQAHDRMITVYLPGHKYTMLPELAIETYSLDSNKEVASLNLTITLDQDYQVKATDFNISKIAVKHNLNIEDFTANEIAYNGIDVASIADIKQVVEISKALNLDKPRDVENRGHLLRLDKDEVIITNRENLAIIDDLIANLMIYYNQMAAKYLLAKDYFFIGRYNGRSTVASKKRPIAYGWFTSPLRRIIDLYNQQQLIAAINNDKPVYDFPDLYKILSEFEPRFQWSKKQQCKLEKYWTFKKMQNDKQKEYTGKIAKQGNLVFLDEMPVAINIPRATILPGSTVTCKVNEIDLFELTATGELV